MDEAVVQLSLHVMLASPVAPASFDWVSPLLFELQAINQGAGELTLGAPA